MSENDQNLQDKEAKNDKGGKADTGADDDLDADLDADLEDLDDEEDDDDDKGDEGKDKKSDQKKETPSDKLARLERQVKRARKEAGITDDKPKTKPGEFDYGQKAYLVASGIKEAKEVKLVKDFMKNTGKDLDAVIESKYFQAELKELREAKATTDAVPKGQKRSGQTSRDSVDYWVAKGELPPASEVELRRKVVNAKMAAQKGGNNFTTQSVVGNA